jgi:hypothetical protein
MRRLRINPGDRFSRLIVLAIRASPRRAFCACDCGNFTSAAVPKLASGHTTSCGCAHYERAFRLNLRHGHAPNGNLSPEYRAWSDMMARCNTPSHDPKRAYLHRGIRVCERWSEGEGGVHPFLCFLADMGEKPGPSYSIERRDHNGDYAPENCYWLPRSLQNRNKRNNRIVVVGGEAMPFIVAVEKFGKVSPQLAYSRVHKGWPDIEAITTPALQSGSGRRSARAAQRITIAI